METISNITTAASKAIWGEPNTTIQTNETAGAEPISGQQGKGTVNEPFDQGNSEDPTSTKNTTSEPTTTTGATSEPTTTTHTSSNPTTTTNATSEPTPTTNTEGPSKPETTNAPMNPNNVASGGEPKPLENTDKTGVTSSTSDPVKGSDVIPSSSSNNPGAAPASGAVAGQKQQGADRPSEAPTGEGEDAVKVTKDEADDLVKKRDPNDHSGEPMKMHDGNEKRAPQTQEERRTSKAGQPGGQEHGKDPKGTGEEWVKTSGLQADGGDFDATKPGAGREADRLLEEKGIKKDDKGAQLTSESSESQASTHDKEKEKVSLGEKIKTKLHIGHKDK